MLDKPQLKSMLDTPVAQRMPREIAPGVFWIGDCLAQRHKGKSYHGYNAAYLVAGTEASILVETGHPKDFPVIERHMNELFARGVAPLKYLFVTHQETPHCGGLGRILKNFPDALLVGDVSDYHLAFPQYEHRMRSMQEGDEIDLGGRTLMAVEPVIRDLRTTWWGFDTKERVLFPGDGFAYSHYHEDGHCGLHRRGSGVARPAGRVVDLRRPGAVLDQIRRHERLLRPARPFDRAARRQDHRPDPRPTDHRCEDHGAESAGRAESRGADAGVGDEREGGGGRQLRRANTCPLPLRERAARRFNDKDG